MNRILRHLEIIREKVPVWKVYPFSSPAVAGLSRLELHPKVTFLVGPALRSSWHNLAAQIYLLDESGIREIPYEETEHYRVTRSFLLNPARMLDEILTEGE